MSTPTEVNKALEHMKTFFPEVTMVVFNIHGQWSYMTDSFYNPDFGNSNIDTSILEDASDSVEVLPAIFKSSPSKISDEVRTNNFEIGIKYQNDNIIDFIENNHIKSESGNNYINVQTLINFIKK